MTKTAVVTCTGGRPELFALCQRWVERQTAKVDMWIVCVDTGEDLVGLPSYAMHVALTPKQGPDHALISALSFVPSDHHIVVMEDDDWYARDHVERCVGRLEQGFHLTGGDIAVRFHLPASRWSGFHTPEGFIQGTTGIHKDFVSRYAKFIGPWPKREIDPHLGGRYEGYTTVGIKGAGHGLPGRAGFTRSHIATHPKCSGMQIDRNHENFIAAIGADDANAYLSLLKP